MHIIFTRHEYVQIEAIFAMRTGIVAEVIRLRATVAMFRCIERVRCPWLDRFRCLPIASQEIDQKILPTHSIACSACSMIMFQLKLVGRQ